MVSQIHQNTFNIYFWCLEIPYDYVTHSVIKSFSLISSAEHSVRPHGYTILPQILPCYLYLIYFSFSFEMLSSVGFSVKHLTGVFSEYLPSLNLSLPLLMNGLAELVRKIKENCEASFRRYKNNAGFFCILYTLWKIQCTGSELWMEVCTFLKVTM